MNDQLDSYADRAHRQDMEKLHAQIEYERERLTTENRRFSVEKSLQFFGNTAPRIIHHGAILEIADVIFQYVDSGKLPDPAESRRDAQKFSDTLVHGAFPAHFETEEHA